MCIYLTVLKMPQELKFQGMWGYQATEIPARNLAFEVELGHPPMPTRDNPLQAF